MQISNDWFVAETEFENKSFIIRGRLFLDAIRQSGKFATRIALVWEYQGDEKGSFAGFFQLLDIGLESGAEHEHHHAQLGEHSEKVTGLDQVEDAGPQQQAGQQRAYHLGHIHPFGKHGKALCDQQDQGHIKNKMI